MLELTFSAQNGKAELCRLKGDKVRPYSAVALLSVKREEIGRKWKKSEKVKVI